MERLRRECGPGSQCLDSPASAAPYSFTSRCVAVRGPEPLSKGPKLKELAECRHASESPEGSLVHSHGCRRTWPCVPGSPCAGSPCCSTSAACSASTCAEARAPRRHHTPRSSSTPETEAGTGSWPLAAACNDASSSTRAFRWPAGGWRPGVGTTKLPASQRHAVRLD